MGDLLARMGDQGIAVVLLVFAIPAIVPTPGIPAGLLFGTALSLLSVQIMAGSQRLSLPKRLSRVSVPRSVVEQTAKRGAPILVRLESFTKPRGTLLVRSGTRPVLGFVVFVVGLLIALPIPFGNIMPGLSILMIALGMAQRDAVAIGAGILVTILAILVSAATLMGGWWLVAEWMGIDQGK
ncbi:exopolysaccharide biosynthesis protein [Rhizobium rhizogenes]|uniref:exopolysaccharide biosynthesis protein n=1 Tax=Rhizobium rhizogenes TaxID=359 RepID=UPI0015741320|nr:exopolysaccharide biosynthesis protein [Rhizobium rhizogenes]NTI32993.1 exopolysaccharide biosynthesis protein [Rhizobium rhizogenes]